jgi:uncharacterized protein YxjI
MCGWEIDPVRIGSVACGGPSSTWQSRTIPPGICACVTLDGGPAWRHVGKVIGPATPGITGTRVSRDRVVMSARIIRDGGMGCTAPSAAWTCFLEENTVRYQIKRRPMRIWKPTDITDNTGAVAFRWHMVPTSTYEIADAAGQVVISFTQEGWNINTRFTISLREGDVSLEGEFSPLHPRLSVAVPGKGTLTLSGEALSQGYTITRAEKTVARVTGGWIGGSGEYTVDIADGEDVPLILACTLAAELSRR